MLERMKWTSIAYAVLYAAAGIFLLLYPGQVADMFCDLFGIALIINGIINIVVYFMIDIRESLYRNDFSSGIIKVLLGIMVIYHKDLFQQIIPFMLSIAIIASGFSKLQDGIDAARIGHPNGWQFLALASISIIFGFVIMLNLIKTENMMLQVAGAAMLYSGITDLYTNLYLSGKIKKFLENLDHPKTEPETRKPEENTPPQESSTAAYVDWNTTATGMDAIREELAPDAHQTPEATADSTAESEPKDE